MKRNLIGFITAGAIATAGLTPTAASADQGRDLLGLIVGIAAIATIADAARKNENRATVSSRNTHRPQAAVRHVYRAPVPPRRCIVQTRTRHGWVSYYGKRCMARLGWKSRGRNWEPSHNRRHNDREYFRADNGWQGRIQRHNPYRR